MRGTISISSVDDSISSVDDSIRSLDDATSPRVTMVSATRTFAVIASFGAAACQALNCCVHFASVVPVLVRWVAQVGANILTNEVYSASGRRFLETCNYPSN